MIQDAVFTICVMGFVLKDKEKPHDSLLFDDDQSSMGSEHDFKPDWKVAPFHLGSVPLVLSTVIQILPI